MKKVNFIVFAMLQNFIKFCNLQKPLVSVMAFALMFAVFSFNGVVADEYVCAETETAIEISISDAGGLLNGYRLAGGVADDETSLYVYGLKSSTDEVVFKLNKTTGAVEATYNVNVPSAQFASDGISISNEGSVIHIYGFDKGTAGGEDGHIWEYNVNTSVLSEKFTTDVNQGFGFAINKDGDNTAAPTKFFITYIIANELRVKECPWSDGVAGADCVTVSNIPHTYTTSEWAGLDWQENDPNQELLVYSPETIAGTPITLNHWINSFEGTTPWVAREDRMASLNTITTTNGRFGGVAHVGNEIKQVYKKDAYEMAHLKTYSDCETIDAGVFVSVNEFDNANQAKAINEGTDYAVFDDEALLGWEAYSFVDTLNSFDGEYSTDATNWVNIAGLQAIGDADEGYITSDFGELFDTTTYKDAGNTTADWDTTNTWVILNTNNINISEEFNSYDTGTWTSPQPAYATIVSNELEVTSTNAVNNIVSSNDVFSSGLTFESNAKLIDNIANSQGQFLGLRETQGAGFTVWHNQLNYWVKDSVGSTYGQITATLGTGYHDYKFVWAATDIKFYFDDVLKATVTTNLPTVSIPVSFRSYAESAVTINMYVNDVDVTTDTTYNSSEIMQTLTLDDTVDIISKFNIATNDTQPANTDITYDVSCNGGSNWETDVTLETSTACAVNGSDLRVKANLSTTDDTTTPTIDNFGINYTTDGSDPITPGVFETNFFSYVWDTSALPNDNYYFKMAATDDDSPANDDDDESQAFTICHGDTLQIFQSPDYSTDLYTLLDCTNTVTIVENNTDDIIVKVVNQDTGNAQSFTLDVNNTTDDDRFYDIYNSTDGITWNSLPDPTLTRKVIKTWTGSTFVHSFSNELSASETEYYKMVYRKPYAIVTAALTGYESTLADDSTADIWVSTQGDIRFNDATCTDLDGGSHCITLAGQSDYSVGAFETSDKLSMTLGSDAGAFSIGFMARYELISPGVPELHVQTRTDPEDAWSDVYVSRNGGTGDNDGIPMTTDWSRFTATITSDAYVKVYIDEPLNGVSNVHFSNIFVLPENFFTGQPLFVKSDGSNLDLLPSGSNTEDSYRYLNEADPFKIQVAYYDKDALIDTVEVTVMVTGGNDIVKIVSVAVSPTVEYLYTGTLDLDGFIDTSDSVTSIYAQVDLIDNDSAESYKFTENVAFKQFPDISTDYKAGIIFDSDSKFVGKAPTGQVTVQMTTTNPLTKIRLKIWDNSGGSSFTESDPNHVEYFLKGTDFVCEYSDCSFTFDLSNEWVWSNEAQFMVKLEPYFSTSSTQPYTDSTVTTSVNIGGGDFMNAVLMFADSSMEHTERLYDLTSESRDATLLSSSETKRFIMKVKSGDGADISTTVNAYLTLFKYGPNTEMTPTKRDGTASEEDISGNTTETTCRAVGTQDACNGTVGCYWFEAPVNGCSSIGDPIPYYMQEYSALNGVNTFYFETPLLEDDGSYMDDASHYGLLGFVDDMTGRYSDRVVVLSRYVPYNSWLPYSANPQRYVAADDETTCFDQGGIESAENCEVDPHCSEDAVDESYGKFRCTRSSVADQFCDLAESCETPLRVSTSLSVTRPTITNISCIPFDSSRPNLYNTACIFTFSDSGSPITGVDILLWNENTDWTQTTNANKQWIQFSVPYEKLRELDTNATYLQDYAEIFEDNPTGAKSVNIWEAIWGPINAQIAASSYKFTADEKSLCASQFGLFVSKVACLEYLETLDGFTTDNKVAFTINSVGFVNTQNYSKLSSRYESGYTTEEQCFGVDYDWNPETSQCFSSVDPKRALEYAAQEDIDLVRSTWNAATVFNGKIQDTYSGSSPMVVDYLPPSDLNNTINAPISATVRIWWEQGGEMMSEQLTVNDLVLLKYSSPTSCGNWTTYAGWGEKFSCYSADITNFIKGNFFFMLVMLMVIAVVFGGMKAARRG